MASSLLRLVGRRAPRSSRSTLMLATYPSFCIDVLADIGCAIFQLDALGFAPRQKFHGIAINQSNPLQIEVGAVDSCPQTQKSLQLSNGVGLDPTTQRNLSSGIKTAQFST